MTRLSAAAFSMLLLGACGKQGESDTGGQADPSKTQVPVGVRQVSQDSVVERLTLTGRLAARPGGAAVLAAPAAGVVQSLRVQIGDTVRRGQLVAELDVPELAADARQK